jgi:hypothetical protein
MNRLRCPPRFSTRKPESNWESARAEKSGRTKGVQTFGLPAREMRVARTHSATPEDGRAPQLRFLGFKPNAAVGETMKYTKHTKSLDR